MRDAIVLTFCAFQIALSGIILALSVWGLAQ